LYEFPASKVEFIHRVGRTGRAGRKGKVTCFVSKKDRANAKKIEEALKNKGTID